MHGYIRHLGTHGEMKEVSWVERITSLSRWGLVAALSLKSDARCRTCPGHDLNGREILSAWHPTLSEKVK